MKFVFRVWVGNIRIQANQSVVLHFFHHRFAQISTDFFWFFKLNQIIPNLSVLICVTCGGFFVHHRFFMLFFDTWFT